MPDRRYAILRKFSAAAMRGSASIEFCLVFILLFMVFYGAAGYTMPLLLSASYQEIAAKSLREAVRLQAESLDDAGLQQSVRDVVDRSWPANTWAEPCAGYGEDFLLIAEEQWKVCLRTNPESIIPVFTLFNWQVPALPDDIRAEAAIRLR